MDQSCEDALLERIHPLPNAAPKCSRSFNWLAYDYVPTNFEPVKFGDSFMQVLLSLDGARVYANDGCDYLDSEHKR